jgi:CubicO group peptidase (beta-lactamase class C family)
MTDKAELARDLHRYLSQKARRGEFSGVVAVCQGDDVWFQRAYGWAGRAFRARNRLDTRFRVASVSKLFTAVAILQLVEDGRLALDTRVTDFLDAPGAGIAPAITIEHLLTMTAGIADWFDESGDWLAAWETLKRSHPVYLLRHNRDYLPLFAGKPAARLPGLKFEYSNSSYILLGLVIEALDGESYIDVTRRRVFEPAGMQRSGFYALDEVVEGMAEGYDPVQDETGKTTGWKRNIYETTPAGAGDGGAVCTAEDLLRFSAALRGGRLLSPQMSAAMLAPRVLEMETRPRGYTWMHGLGCQLLLNSAGQVVRWGHTGEEAGVSCRLYHYPRSGVDVVILGNQGNCAREPGWQIHDWLCRPE